MVVRDPGLFEDLGDVGECGHGHRREERHRSRRDVVRGEDLLHCRRSGAEREVVVRPLDRRRVLAVARRGDPHVEPVFGKRCLDPWIAEEVLLSEPMAPRTICRGLFEDPLVHTTTVLTTDTAK